MKVMHIGFTGTQQGMTPAQIEALTKGFTLIDRLNQTVILHHGDCFGADAEAHDIALSCGLYVHIHPPINESKRAWKQVPAAHVFDGRWVNPPLEYLARNKVIVDSAQILFATPHEDAEQLRSGTWSTVRYARRKGRQVILILPNGRLHG
jgi:hypothetical protein